MTINPKYGENECIKVNFEHGGLYLQYDGNINVFMNDFEGILDYFVKQVLDDYSQLVHKGPDCEDCFNAMIKEFETVECPYLIKLSVGEDTVDDTEEGKDG